MNHHQAASAVDRELRKALRKPARAGVLMSAASIVALVWAAIAQLRAFPTPTLALPALASSLMVLWFSVAGLAHRTPTMKFDGTGARMGSLIGILMSGFFLLGIPTVASWALVGAFSSFDVAYRCWGAAIGLGVLLGLSWRKVRQRLPEVRLEPSGFVCVQPYRHYPWDGMTATHGQSPTPQWLAVSLASADGTPGFLATSGMRPCMWQLIWTIEHFRDHPEDRAVLGTPDGPAFVENLINYPIEGRHPWPRWFRPPPAAWAAASLPPPEPRP